MTLKLFVSTQDDGGTEGQRQEPGDGEEEEVPRQTAAGGREEAGGVLVRGRQPPQGPLPEEGDGGVGGRM